MSTRSQRLTLRELRAGESKALKAFYQLYKGEFPDRNERESLQNMAHCLRHRNRSQRAHQNNYHILVAYLDGTIVGGSIFNYFARPNAGVIEFLFVNPKFRGQNLGRRILQRTEVIIKADALQIGVQLRAILAEMNDPFYTPAVPDNMDPFERTVVWGKWGFSRLDFQYIQPPLDPSKSAVRGLCLIGKITNSRLGDSLPSSWVGKVIHDYMRWAMRIQRPQATVEFAKMTKELTRARQVRLTPLQAHVRRDPKHVFLQ
jgi:GNAT superfamily N-acetyltransferase